MKKICSLVAATIMVAGAHAEPLTVCDFEDYPVGTTWTLWSSDGNAVTSTATVETDPVNADNKVLHIKLEEWGCHPEFKIPTELRGKALTDRYPIVTCDIYRSSNDAADNYKRFAVFIGSQEVYRDETSCCELSD